MNFVHLRSLNHNYPFLLSSTGVEVIRFCAENWWGPTRGRATDTPGIRGPCNFRDGCHISWAFNSMGWLKCKSIGFKTCILINGRGERALTSILGDGGRGTHLQCIYQLVLHLGIQESNFNMFSLNMQMAQLWISSYHSVMALILLESTHWTVSF